MLVKNANLGDNHDLKFNKKSILFKMQKSNINTAQELYHWIWKRIQLNYVHASAILGVRLVVLVVKKITVKFVVIAKI